VNRDSIFRLKFINLEERYGDFLGERKKALLSCLAIILLIAFTYGIKYGVNYLTSYTIKPEKTQLEDAILKRINRPTTITTDLDIKQVLNLDNKKYVFLAFRGYEGEAEFTLGINKKYKIGGVGYGTSAFRNDIIKTNKGKYIITICKNINNDIQYEKVCIDNRIYKMDIPQEEYVIAYCKVPKDTPVDFVNFENIKFYNKDNLDITQEVFSNQ
jgi:hypothetical protein